MKSKSWMEQIMEEFESSDNRYCAYCLVLEGGHGCDCDQRAWRTFGELDEASQKEVISQEFDLTKEKQ
jgi:hypothetical protein